MKYKLITWRVKRMEKRIKRLQSKYNKFVKEKYLPAINEEVGKSKTNIEKLNTKYNDYYSIWSRAIQN